MSEAQLMSLRKKLTPRTNKYIPMTPTVRQSVFLLVNDKYEVLYGGAAGGGKSEALLAGAAQFVDIPGYSALLLRRSFRDLALPGALMDRSKKWWTLTDAHWDGSNYKWTFPSGATIQFGYLEHDGDELRYQSAEFQFIGFDELTQFRKDQYTYMFSRLRRIKGVEIPLRIRAATNPGGVGHVWVKDRWNLPTGDTGDPERVFIPAKLEDNPHLDQDMYEKSFDNLNELTRAQLRHGDWDAQSFGGKLDPAWFQVIGQSDLPERKHWTGVVRHWDLAAQAVTEEATDPDWTAGVKVIRSNVMPERVHDRLMSDIKAGADLEYPKPPYWYITDVARDRREAGGVEELVTQTAHLDGVNTHISIEQERGASGKLLIEHYRRNILNGFKVHRLWSAGGKEDRAAIVAGRAKEGRYFLVEGPHVSPLLDEMSVFGIPNVHDDQIDGLSGAHIQIEKLDAITSVGTQVKQY